MRKLYAITLILLCFIPEAAAQRYEIIERRNFWNSGRNVTGIRMDSVTISLAELYGKGAGGGYRDYSDAARTWSAGAEVKTITHAEKYSMTGAFSFDHTAGYDVCGSMFINPGLYPVDVLEFTPGRKDLQTYSFMGGISSDIGSEWRLGARVDFASANYAKRKDLRHTNYRLDMSVVPGVMYHSGNRAAGLSYILGKNSETVSAETIGDKEYDAFLDKGLMYGVYSIWKDSGIHLDESALGGLPVKEISHGAAVQVQFGELYADAEYVYGNGVVGDRGVYWFYFPSHSVSTHLGYRYLQDARSHFFRLNFTWSYLSNYDSSWEEVNVNGTNIVRVYGMNKIFGQEKYSLNPEYEYISSGVEFRFGVNTSVIQALSTQMYPYAILQRMTYGIAYASGLIRAGKFDVEAAAAFSRGIVTEDTRAVDAGIDTGELYRLTEYYDWVNEYMTAPRLILGAALRYNFTAGAYAEAGAEYARGFNLRHISGAVRWNAMLKLGYTF